MSDLNSGILSICSNFLFYSTGGDLINGLFIYGAMKLKGYRKNGERQDKPPCKCVVYVMLMLG